MRYLLISILLFITINCFAIDQKLINGAKEYEIAEANLHKIFDEINSNSMSLDEFIKELHKTTNNNLSAEDKAVVKNKIDKKHNQLYELNSRHAEAEAVVKKLEPLKKEYDKQKGIEFENKQFSITILVVTTISLIVITFFGAVIWLIISQRKKYQQLLKEGKITQAEYDRIMSSSSSYEKSTLFRDDNRTNPATGLRMIGGCDSGGNPYGSSFNNSSTSETHRTRWE